MLYQADSVDLECYISYAHLECYYVPMPCLCFVSMHFLDFIALPTVSVKQFKHAFKGVHMESGLM